MGERIRCRKCGDILQSKYRHDFQMCKCGSCYIDGGDDYCRVGGEKENIEWIDRNDGKQFKYLFDYCEEIINKKIMSNWYTRGRLDRKTWKLEDQENEFLYSEGKYITKIKEIDLALGNEEKVDIVKYCNEIIQKNKKDCDKILVTILFSE